MIQTILEFLPAEIIIRTLCILFVAEGLHALLEMPIELLPYFRLRKWTTLFVLKFVEFLGYCGNIIMSYWAAKMYALDRPKELILYEGFAYGLGTIFIHILWNRLGLTKILKNKLTNWSKIKWLSRKKKK